jgi:hypothetical protein
MGKSDPKFRGTTTALIKPSGGRKPVYGPLPVAHPFYATVERVTAEWTHLEHALDMIICELAVVDRQLGFCITGQLSGHWPRINAITALASAKSLNKGITRELELLGTRLSKLERKRNLFLRQVWSYCDVPATTDATSHSGGDEGLTASGSSVEGTLDLILLVQAEIIVLWRIQSRLRSDMTTS